MQFSQLVLLYFWKIVIKLCDKNFKNHTFNVVEFANKQNEHAF